MKALREPEALTALAARAVVLADEVGAGSTDPDQLVDHLVLAAASETGRGTS